MGKSGNVITFGNSHDFKNLRDFTKLDIRKVYLDHDGKITKKPVAKRKPVSVVKSKPKAKKRLRDQKNKGKRKHNKQ